ncbi:MAG: hypothetical protein Ct9H300mP12_17710 [Acidimicrobiales bacterium]|nr:MAG: hypothetical protein Ct9H300mP12_17710 [Acidimicrobiales bacterium]
MVPFMADRSEWQTPLWAIFTWTSPGASPGGHVVGDDQFLGGRLGQDRSEHRYLQFRRTRMVFDTANVPVDPGPGRNPTKRPKGGIPTVTGWTPGAL